MSLAFSMNVVIWGTDVSFDFILRRYIAKGRYNLGLDSRFYFASDGTMQLNWAPEWNEIDILDYFIGISTFIGICFRQSFAYLGDCFMLFLILTLWTPVQGFKHTVNQKVRR